MTDQLILSTDVVTGNVDLICGCGSLEFRVRFVKSKSVKIYESYGATGHKPDTMQVICARCETVITVTETSAKMHDTFYDHLNDLKRAARKYSSGEPVVDVHDRYCMCHRCKYAREVLFPHDR